MRHWLRLHWHCLVVRAFRSHILDVMTEMYHPEFGTEWQEGGELHGLMQQQERLGWTQCLNSVLASLRDYPNGGGDVAIMKEVERIVAAKGRITV